MLMLLTIKQQLNKLSKGDCEAIRGLSHAAKNLTNEAIYFSRQSYFEDGRYLSYEKLVDFLKDSESYKALGFSMAKETLRRVEWSFSSFCALMRKGKKGVRLPNYLPKDGYAPLFIGMLRIECNKLVLPLHSAFGKPRKSVKISLPPNIIGKRIRLVKIIPKSNGRFFEIQYTYEARIPNKYLDKSHAMGLDFGIDNLVTAVTNRGKSFIIDGRKLKSINQWYNKEISRLQSIRDLQGYGKQYTKKQLAITNKRNNQVNDYLSKAARIVVNYCKANDIGTLVVGYNYNIKNEVSMGKVSNQNFFDIPFYKLTDKLKYLCKMYCIDYVEQEESFTSKASFWDKDIIPKYNGYKRQTNNFSGCRIHRGMYRTSNGTLINADVNGALNILRKSNIVDLSALYDRGKVDTPERIKIDNKQRKKGS